MTVQTVGAVQPAERVARSAGYLVLQGIVVNVVNMLFFAFVARKLPTTADLGRFTTLITFAGLIMTVSAGKVDIP